MGNKPAPKGNNYKEKWKTPEERQKAFKEICAHLERGLSKNCLKVCDWDTVERYLEKYPADFPSDRLEEAFRVGMQLWEEIGLDGTRGEIQGFNATSWAFNVKNRYSRLWRDKHELDHNVTGEIIVEIGGSVDDDE